MNVKETRFQIVASEKQDKKGNVIYGVFEVPESKRSKYSKSFNYFARYLVAECGQGIKKQNSTGKYKDNYLWDLKFYFYCDDITQWEWFNDGDYILVKKPLIKKHVFKTKLGYIMNDVHLECKYEDLKRLK